MSQFFSRKDGHEETDYFYSLVVEPDQTTIPAGLDGETRQVIEQMAFFEGDARKVSAEKVDEAQKRVWQQLAAKFNLEDNHAPVQSEDFGPKHKVIPPGPTQPIKISPRLRWSWPRVLVGGLAVVTLVGIVTLVLITLLSAQLPNQQGPRSLLNPGTGLTPVPTVAALPPTETVAPSRTTLPATPSTITTAPAIPTTPRINGYSSIPLSGFNGPVTQVVWSPDGKYFAASSNADPVVRVWKLGSTLEQTTLLAALQGHQGGVLSLAWAPDGKTLASGGNDHSVILWNIPAGTFWKTLIAPQSGAVQALTFAPDGKTLAAAYQRNPQNVLVTLWRASDWTAAKTLDSGTNFFQAYNLQWSPDGKYLAGGMTLYKLWRADGTEVGTAYNGGAPAWGLAWSPDSQRFAVASESSVLYFYDTSAKELGYVHASNGDWLAWSPDGKILASGQYVISLTKTDQMTFSESDVIINARTPNLNANSLAWSPDSKILAVGGAPNSQILTGGETQTTAGVASTDNNLLTLWDRQGQITDILHGHTGQVNVVAWSPVGRVLVSGSDDKTVRLWSIKP